MKRLLIVTLISAGLALPGLVTAQSTERVDKRQQLQGKRIQQGIASGQLNKREAARLNRGQQHVQNVENKALADGKVTQGEKARIEVAQDVQSRRILRQKHDRQKAKTN